MVMKEFLMKLVLNNIYANPDILKDETAYKILSDMIECKDCEKCHAKIKPCVDGKPTCIATVLMYYLKVTKTINGEANSHNQTAQPEIIRCKDCKYYKYSEWILPHMCCHYLFGATVIREPNDFCSRAERREE